MVKTAKPSTTVTTSTPEVVQIAQFLLTASSLTSTGIKIDSAVTTACAAQNINLSTAPASNFTSAIGQIATAAGNRSVTSTTDAQNHITDSMNGLSSGIVVLPPGTSIGGSTTTTPKANQLIGSWIPNNGSNAVVTFLDNTNYIVAQASSGLQTGTYSYNSSTGAFRLISHITNTMGEGGIDIGTGTLTLSGSGNIATFLTTSDPSNPSNVGSTATMTRVL